jgi:hypothetical protein
MGTFVRSDLSHCADSLTRSHGARFQKRLKQSPERSEWVLISGLFLVFEPVTSFRVLNEPFLQIAGTVENSGIKPSVRVG